MHLRQGKRSSRLGFVFWDSDEIIRVVTGRTKNKTEGEGVP